MFFAFLSVCAWILESRALGLPLSESFGLTKHFLGNIVTPFAVVFSWSNFDHPTYISIGLILSISILWYYVGKKRVTVSELVFGIVIVLSVRPRRKDGLPVAAIELDAADVTRSSHPTSPLIKVEVMGPTEEQPLAVPAKIPYHVLVSLRTVHP